MDSNSLFSCCLSRKDKKKESSKTIESNDEIIRQKIKKRTAYDEEEDSSFLRGGTSTSQVRTHKHQNRLTTSMNHKMQSEGAGRMTAYKIGLAEDFFNEEGLENMVEDLKMKVYTHAQWMKILKNDDLENTSMAEVIHSLRHGVKDELRPLIWEFLTKIKDLKKQYPSDHYRKLRGTASDHDQEIKADVARTFPTHQFFTDETTHAKSLLFNVLRAYANHDTETGYAHGMNFIVGKLLIILEPDNFCESELKYYETFEQEYEEKVFWLFVHTNTILNWKQVYNSKSAKMLGLSIAFDSRLRSKFPEIHEIVKNNQTDMTKYFQPMFSCLFMEYTSVSMSKRLFDLFFIEEEKTLFKVLIRAMMLCKKELTNASRSGNLEKFLQCDLLELCGYKYRSNLYIVFPGADAVE